MARISVLVEYDGTDYHGWQRQDGVPTVQGALADAVARMLGTSDGPAGTTGGDGGCIVQGASRTDQGVHAFGQVAHFDDPKGIPVSNWILGLNANLPRGVGVTNAAVVPERFHSRHDSMGKTYRYSKIGRAHV